jgi:hypothetical protein
MHMRRSRRTRELYTWGVGEWSPPGEVRPDVGRAESEAARVAYEEVPRRRPLHCTARARRVEAIVDVYLLSARVATRAHAVHHGHGVASGH